MGKENYENGKWYLFYLYGNTVNRSIKDCLWC